MFTALANFIASVAVEYDKDHASPSNPMDLAAWEEGFSAYSLAAQTISGFVGKGVTWTVGREQILSSLKSSSLEASSRQALAEKHCDPEAIAGCQAFQRNMEIVINIVAALPTYL